MTLHRIPLPYGPTPYLHANQRLHHMEHARKVRDVRSAVGWLAKSHGVGKGHEHVTVGLEWRPAVARRRDGNENLGPLVKALVDGLVGAGVVPGDTPDRVTRTTPVLLDVDAKSAGLWLTVETP